LSARALSDPRKIHVEDFADYDSDLEQFFHDVVTPLAEMPTVALAHSMGGHILLRALYRRPSLVIAAVLSAPMLNINLRGRSEGVARLVSAALCAGGRAREFVWGMEAHDPRRVSFAENYVTRDEARFRRWQAAVEADHGLCVNGPTWGWLKASLAAMRILARPGVAENISTPLLFCGAGADRVVETKAVAEFAKRAPNADYVEFAGSEHEILMERDVIRAQFWSAFDEFMRRSGV
jgi:lysophospholipase